MVIFYSYVPLPEGIYSPFFYVLGGSRHLEIGRLKLAADVQSLRGFEDTLPVSWARKAIFPSLCKTIQNILALGV